MHSIVVVNVNLVNNTKINTSCDLKELLVKNEFEDYLNNSTLVWQDDIAIEDIKVVDVLDNCYIFIEIEHNTSILALDIALQGWVEDSGCSEYLATFYRDHDIVYYLDILNAVIVKDRTIPDSFDHNVKVSVLNSRDSLFLEKTHNFVIKLEPPKALVIGVKTERKTRPLTEDELFIAKEMGLE